MINFSEDVGGVHLTVISKADEDYCEVMTTSDFYNMVDHNLLNPYDGSGYWANSNGYDRNSDCFGAQPIWATHVVWFNK